MEDIDMAIELEPSNYGYYFDKYFILVDLNEEDEAKVTLQSTMNIEANDETDRFNNAKANYYLENYDEAFEGLQIHLKKGLKNLITI